MQLDFRVKEQIITRLDDKEVVADSVDYLTCKFEFCEDWKDATPITAVFESNTGEVYNVILENNECTVPWEVICRPSFDVSVFGGNRITTNPLSVKVCRSGYCEGEPSREPTPDVYEQILGQFQDIKGKDSVIGHYGYYIHSINIKEKWVILSDSYTKPSYPYIGSDAVDDSDPTYITGFDVGDMFSMVNGAHYDFCGTITDIEGNKIYYEDDLPFVILDSTTNDFDDHIFFVPSKPKTGIVEIVTIAFATGIGTKAPGKASFGAGRDGVAGGDYSFIGGRRTFASYCATAFGLDCLSYGRYSFSVGCLCKALGEYSASINMGCIAESLASFAHGEGTISRTRAMESGGRYNETTTDKIIVYGNGTDVNNRKDAYWLDWDGLGYFAGGINTDGRLAVARSATIGSNLTVAKHINSKFIKEDYFDNGKVDSTMLGIADFDDLTEPGFYNLMYYHKNDGGEEEYTPWRVMVSVKYVNGRQTRILQLREAFGQNTGKVYLKQTRVRNIDAYGKGEWTEWTNV